MCIHLTPKSSFFFLCHIATLWYTKGSGWFKKREREKEKNLKIWMREKEKYMLHSVTVLLHWILMEKSNNSNSMCWSLIVYHIFIDHILMKYFIISHYLMLPTSNNHLINLVPLSTLYRGNWAKELLNNPFIVV